jgi:hypothetical protein
MATYMKGKIQPTDVGASGKGGSNPAGNSGGGLGKSVPQKAIPGPEKTGGPVSLKRALAKKTMPSKGL